MITKIPINEAIKKLSAIFSKRASFCGNSARMEMNDKTHEIVRNNATIEVNSSIKEFCERSVRWREVMINKQNPNKLAEVDKMC